MAGFLFFLSSQPDLRVAEDPVLDLILRKVGHAAAFGLLAILVSWAMAGERDVRSAVSALLIVVAYAGSDELHQGFVHGRSASFLDLLVDAAGAAIGVILWRSRPIGRSRAGSG